jgi:tetratricopeptide (TPR) repeat protein
MSYAAAEALTVQGNEAFVREDFASAAVCFERACTVYPQHPVAWKGLGHALLSQGRSNEAARAFDRAIGLRPTSATALWGGAIAHADLGHALVAKNYLGRALALQPSWRELAFGVPQLAPLMQLSAHAGDLLRRALGAFSTRSFKHAMDPARAIAVGRVQNSPDAKLTTHVSLGLCDHVWPVVERPRLEIALASNLDGQADDLGAQIVANTVFHLIDQQFYPEPGSLVRDLVAVLGAGDLSRRLPHVYFAVPRPWRLHLPLDVGPPAITLAQAVLVSEAEYAHWKQFGPPGLDYVFLDRQVDVTDLRRASVL